VNQRTSDPSSIERELAETRARLGSRLDELTRRLSPGQLVDEGLAYLRHGQGAEFTRNLAADLRDNPLPVALTGLGLTWLAVSTGIQGSRRGSGSQAVVPYDEARAREAQQDDVSERARRAGEKVARAADETEEAFRSRVADARAAILGVQRQAAETASAFADRVDQAMKAAQDSARSGLRRARDTAGEWRDELEEGGRRGSQAVDAAIRRGSDYAARAGGGIAETFGDNPLLLAALGITAGALLGALVPRTAQEDAWLGPSADHAMRAARQAADEAVHRGARVADAAVSAGYRAAQEETRRHDSPG
jgi:hypothetical protein